MFNNLIESSSHTREFKRRGSFFLYTVAAYLLLFTAAGVASIYAYDAQLDEQTEQIITMLRPVDLPSPPKRPDAGVVRPPRNPRGGNTVDERRVAVASINHPEIPPAAISTKPNPDLPVIDGHLTVITGRDRNGEIGSPLDSGPPSTRATTPSVVQITEVLPPPPPPAVKKPVPPIVSKGAITGEAIELPRPLYPQLAKINRIQGAVGVQVLIDEGGKVISAHAVSGNAFLTTEAVRAAYRARFSPTKLSGQPVKVSGLITYNFVLN
jgi:protein TonB